jgi:hypothetical protein
MSGTTLMQASHEWMTRPMDERFISLPEMESHFATIREQSRGAVVASRRMLVRPLQDNKGIEVVGPNGNAYAPTHWAFGQLAARAEAPAGYLRTLPSPIAADALNYGLQFKRDIEDVGVLLQRNGESVLRAVTGPNYGRIWNADIVSHLISRFGDGVTGEWKVPGEFGKAVTVTRDNTTLFAGDRDMFVFLCDEDHRIDIPDRREGNSGSLARGFFVWNSEVGSATFGLATFLFDYVCCNRIVWGAREFKQVTIRRTASAPDKYLDELRPALHAYALGSSQNVVDAVLAAKKARLDPSGDEVSDFLRKRFSTRVATAVMHAHEAAEGRPIENLWDATCAVTEYAKGIKWQDERVALERQAGDILDLATR